MPLTQRGRTARSLVVAAVALAVVTAAVVGIHRLYVTLTTPFTPPACQATVRGQTWQVDPEQMANVATIAGIAMKRRLPPRAATIALATARQESKFVNLDRGDRDSLGLFQQRPSQGWGTAAQVSDPVYATNAFYDRLVTIRGYQSMAITVVAQRIQRSAFPEAYADHEAEARVYASALTGRSPAALTCSLDPTSRPAGAGGPPAFTRAVRREQVAVSVRPLTGVGLRLDAADTTQAWSLAQWSVASAQRLGVARVYVDGRVWVRSRPHDGWQPTGQGGAAAAPRASGVLVLFSDTRPPTS